MQIYEHANFDSKVKKTLHWFQNHGCEAEFSTIKIRGSISNASIIKQNFVGLHFIHNNNDK